MRAEKAAFIDETCSVACSTSIGELHEPIYAPFGLGALRAWKRPGAGPGLSCWFGVEPPAGIEPATPSLPWNHREPLCGAPFPQVTPDRRGQSYRFSSGEVMRSL